MAVKLLMPQLGESVVDGTVSEWLKQEGDSVEEYESIVRISTDKVDTEIPAPASGVLLKIYVEEGETVDSGVVLAMIGAAGESVPDSLSGVEVATDDHSGNGSKPQPARRTAVSAGNRQERYTGHVTPVVARMAAEHNLDLSQIKGTGRDGRITKKDVEAYLEQGSTATSDDDLPAWERPGSGDLFKPTVDYELEASSPAKAKPRPQIAPAAAAPSDIPGELVELTTMRRSIAEHMVRSKLHTSPHVTTVFEVDLSAVVAHRNAHKATFAQQGVKLTFTPYFVVASVNALAEVPYANSRWTNDGIFLQHAANIGMAVAIDDGLIVPVIKNAQDYNLNGLARRVTDLAERARNRQLKPDEVQGGTFTITNHGVSGSLVATPIINQPQVAILGVGMIEKRVKVINDAIAIRPCVYLSLTFDHRVLDGASADRFLQVIKRDLENWS